MDQPWRREVRRMELLNLTTLREALTNNKLLEQYQESAQTREILEQQAHFMTGFSVSQALR